MWGELTYLRPGGLVPNHVAARYGFGAVQP
jgi:hypothetical protein